MSTSDLNQLQDELVPYKPPYSVGEEIANSVTSGIGTALSIAGLVVMIVYAASYGDVWHITSVSIFGAALILSHLSSTLYHSISPPRAKNVLKLFDHLAIYILIAGTYTPFVLVNMRGNWGWTLFTIIWGLAVLGVIIKLTRLNNIRGLSTGFYVAMGWCVILAINPMLETVAAGGIKLLLAGGICYTVGVVFYAWKSMPYSHAIWHCFVIAGSICHFFAVLFYVIPMEEQDAVINQNLSQPAIHQSADPSPATDQTPNP